MPEFAVGGAPRSGNGGSSLTNMPTPILLGDLQPLLPTLENPIGEAIVNEASDALSGRAENKAVDEKIGKKLLKKGIRGGPLGEAISDVLFGDNKAGAPDPPRDFSKPSVDSEGRAYQFDSAGNLVLVQMLPMWMADP